ncbi:IPT/TIG domain-containing protein [bacterium]|nr:IPT/TIG domain-containing protein [bacterium]
MRRNFISVALIALAIFAMLIFWGCSDDNDPDTGDGPTEEQLNQLEDIQQSQLDYYTEFENLLAEMDTASAKDSIVAIMSTDASIEWALVTLQGINIQYNFGMRGGLFLDPLRYDVEDSMRGYKGDYGEQEGMAVSGLVVPTSEKTLYLAPAYSQFTNADNYNLYWGKWAFRKVGYDDFVKYTNANCDVERFCYLSDWGIIRISSHGDSWPSETDIQEVYLMTGEVANRTTNTEYFDNIRAGDMPIVLCDGENKYWISPAFFGVYNDLSLNKTVVSLGFCYSFLGGWPTTIIDECGASACLGYDWAVQADKDANWTRDFFDQLCDTTRATPLTIGEWYAAIENTYYSNTFTRWVSIRYAGDDSTALWIPLRITSISPTSGMEDTIVTIRGVGFGDTEAQVMFNDVVATDILVWTDTLIMVAVPAGFAEGAVVIVTVVVDGMGTNGVEFTIATASVMDLLRTMNQVGINFQGSVIRSNGWGWMPGFSISSSNEIDTYLPLLWTGNTVSATGTIEGSDNFDYLVNISITLSPDGQNVLSVTAEKTGTARPGTSATGGNYYKLAFVNIPFSQSSGSLVAYKQETDVQSHTTDIDISSYGSGGDYSLESVDWGYSASARIDFHYYDIGK